MIKNLFKRFRKKKSVYQKIIQTQFNREELEQLDLSDGSWEYRYLSRQETLTSVSTLALNEAVDDFYGGEKDSLEEIDEFFREHRALESEEPFFRYLLQKIEFNEDKLIGLSILLMRDSTEEESVKFGMLLTKYYNVGMVRRPFQLLKELSLHPAFVYYSLDQLKNIDYGIIDEIYERTYGNGKKIIEEKIWK